MVYQTGVPEKLHPRRKGSYEIGQEHVAAARLPDRWTLRRCVPVMWTCQRRVAGVHEAT